MSQVKINCDYCPPTHHKKPSRDWDMHPSWITGIDALASYNDWVSSVVLPVAFQWIDEHRAEVYATVPEELKDDVGVVLAAAFKLIKDLPAYQRGLAKKPDCEELGAKGDVKSINPIWTGITKKVRTATEEAFAEQGGLLGELAE